MFKWYMYMQILKELEKFAIITYEYCMYCRRPKRKSRRAATTSRRRGDSAETGVASTLLASMDNSTISTPNDSVRDDLVDETSPLNYATSNQQGSSVATLQGKCA